MNAKLGDTVEIRHERPFEVCLSEWYATLEENIEKMQPLRELKTLTTQAEVDEWNEEHK